MHYSGVRAIYLTKENNPTLYVPGRYQTEGCNVKEKKQMVVLGTPIIEDVR